MSRRSELREDVKNFVQVHFVFLVTQVELPVGVKPDVPFEILQAHELQRSSEFHPYAFDVVCGHSCRHNATELEAAVTTLVADGLVVKPKAFQPPIPTPLVRIDRGTRFDVLLDELLERCLCSVRQHKEEGLLGLIFPGLGEQLIHLGLVRDIRQPLLRILSILPDVENFNRVVLITFLFIFIEGFGEVQVERGNGVGQDSSARSKRRWQCLGGRSFFRLSHALSLIGTLSRCFFTSVLLILQLLQESGIGGFCNK